MSASDIKLLGMDTAGPREATIYQVAELAGVAISTVSLAINHPERVAPRTRERILAAVDELGFVPKERAVARARHGVGRVAVIAPFSSYPSFARRLAGILGELAPSGLHICVFDHEDVAISDAPVLATLPMRGHFDGLIVMSVPVDDSIVARLRGRIPAVLIDQRHSRLPSVSIDNVMGGRLVGEYLVAQGHRTVAFVREDDRSALDSAPGRLRAAGLRNVMGDGVEEIVIERGSDVGGRALARILAAAEPTTAVFAENDLLATRILGAAREAGLAVPRELSIIGFDDDPMAQAIGLTTVRAPFEESGAAAARILNGLIDGAALEGGDTVLDVELFERSTSGPRSTTMVATSKHFDPA